MEDLKNIKINREDVLHYMGSRGNIAPSILSMVDRYILESEKYITPRHTVLEFDIIRKNKKISIGGIELEGLDIAEFLSDNDKCYLMCATIGYEIEREIDRAKAKGPLEQVILDSIGTAAIESLCDKIQNSLGNSLTRFSPGYGDLPLKLQPGIIKLLNAEKLIGVNVTDMLILTPRKSVTAIIARKKDCKIKLDKCKTCNYNCTYRIQ